MRSLYHQEIKLNGEPYITVDASESLLGPGKFEVMAMMSADGEELESRIVATKEEAEAAFNEILSHYPQPTQEMTYANRTLDVTIQVISKDAFTVLIIDPESGCQRTLLCHDAPKAEEDQAIMDEIRSWASTARDLAEQEAE